ncbi:hypothetical protein ACHQM5_011706 [Ranunculus cassubicifolius]
MASSLITKRVFIVSVLLVTLGSLVSISNARCEFEAIFNFGDSNSDIGGFYAAFPSQSGPYGMTYFKTPSGRASDGRLIIDFLAQAMGIPFLSPYLQSIGSNYKHGANFATAASTVLQPSTSLFVSGVSPFYLNVQLNQMKLLKAKVDHGSSDQLPSADIFGKSLYTFNIGQNDFTSNLASVGISGVHQRLPEIINQIAGTIKEVYSLGGRTFLVQNLAPIGCYPAFLTQLPHASSDLDEHGCMVSYNNEVVNYNNMLKDVLAQTRKDLPDASIIHVDTHSLILELFRNPKGHGFSFGPKACCGHGGGSYNFYPQVQCGNSKVISGNTVTATSCEDPYHYVSWDGVHTTEAANKQIAQRLLVALI